MKKVLYFGALASFLVQGCGGEEPQAQSPFPVITGETGCVIEQITTAPYDQFQFQGVTRDGKWLSYAWDRDAEGSEVPERGVITLNLITGEQVVPPLAINSSGAFSPDGTYLTGSRFTETGRDIYEYNRGTGEIKDIALDDAMDFLPSYSPDGKYILFNSYRTGGNDLYLYTRADGTLQRLTDYDGYDAHGEFSNDGSKIMFHRGMGKREDDGWNYDIVSLDLATREETKLTTSEAEEAYGSWAPDGEHLVLSSDVGNPPGQPNIYIYDLAGNEVVRLTKGDWMDTYSFWSRDGAYIYFNSNRNGVTNIYRMHMDGLDCKKAK